MLVAGGGGGGESTMGWTKCWCCNSGLGQKRTHQGNQQGFGVVANLGDERERAATMGQGRTGIRELEGAQNPD